MLCSCVRGSLSFFLCFAFLSASTLVRPALAADKLDLVDISWLFAPPKTVSDLGKLISIADLKSNGAPVWSDEAFKRFIEIANSEAGKVAGTERRISLVGSDGEPLTKMSDWHIAAFRIDPGAPGLSKAVVDAFGRAPQIRLTLQPVIKSGRNQVVVNDVTAHLIYTFAKGILPPAEKGCLRRIVPDDDKFKAIVTDIVALKKKLAFGRVRIVTDGKPLGVHPGFKDPRTARALRNEVKAFLERHLSAAHLGAMAVMGLPEGAPEPWIFVAMQVVRPGTNPKLPNGGIVPVPSPTLEGNQAAQMLSFIDGPDERVGPVPVTNNLKPVTCRFNNPADPDGAFPLGQREGVATAALFKNSDPDERTRDRKTVTAGELAQVGNIVDLIADPLRSHFFNTDCVSCHTDTRRSMVKIGSAFKGIDPAALPQHNYNVRNFGWFFSTVTGGQVVPTVTRRVRTETEEGLRCINATLANNGVTAAAECPSPTQ